MPDPTGRNDSPWDYIRWLEARVKEAREYVAFASGSAVTSEFSGEMDDWLAATKDVP
jgi:hypothetical protein